MLRKLIIDQVLKKVDHAALNFSIKWRRNISIPLNRSNVFQSRRYRIADRSPNRRDRFDCFCANVHSRKINDSKKRERADVAGSFQFSLKLLQRCSF